MAKVPFSKLQAKVDGEVTKNSYCNLAGEEIYYEVKHYLPFEQKLELVSTIINKSIDDNGFYNPMRVKLYMTLEVVYAYTNLSFTDKMKEDPFKLYDILVSTGIFTDIIGGNRCKMFTILVEPINKKDYWFTAWKRPIENNIKMNYKKKQTKEKK